MYSIRINGNPRTLRTPLISPYNSILTKHSNRVKHFEPLGLSPLLKEIDFNASQCSRTLGIFGVDRMSKTRLLKELTGLTCLKERKGIIWADTDETNQDRRTR